VAEDTLTITDNRTGQEYTLPITDGTIRATDLQQLRIDDGDSGLMAYAEGQTDLSLRLFDGSIHQFRPTDPSGFQLTYFRVNDIRVKNVFDELQRNTGESIRGDREMSTCEMLSVIREADQEESEARRDRRDLLRDDLRATEQRVTEVIGMEGALRHGVVEGG